MLVSGCAATTTVGHGGGIGEWHGRDPGSEMSVSMSAYKDSQYAAVHLTLLDVAKDYLMISGD